MNRDKEKEFVNEKEEYVRDRITQLRLKKDVSEREMSLSLGMSESYIRSITSGDGLPSMKSFLNICEYLEITESEFFDSDLSMPPQVRKAYLLMEKLFGVQLPYFIEWLEKMEKFHGDCFIELLRLK